MGFRREAPGPGHRRTGELPPRARRGGDRGAEGGGAEASRPWVGRRGPGGWPRFPGLGTAENLLVSEGNFYVSGAEVEPGTFALSYSPALVLLFVLIQGLAESLSGPGWARTRDPSASACSSLHPLFKNVLLFSDTYRPSLPSVCICFFFLASFSCVFSA